jgi:hypothetical protein
MSVCIPAGPLLECVGSTCRRQLRNCIRLLSCDVEQGTCTAAMYTVLDAPGLIEMTATEVRKIDLAALQGRP